MTTAHAAPPRPTTAPTPSTPTRPGTVRRFRPDIEGLRAVAVVLVVLAHSGLALSGGYVGVDVFFVISGFLITRQLHAELTTQHRISFSRFYARRARRILPAAALVIVATLVASWRVLSPLQVGSVVKDGIFAAFSGINWRLAAQGTDYFNLANAPSPFQHYWSLAVEEQFYAVWPLLLVVIALTAGRRIGRTKALVWSLLAVAAVSFYLSATTTASSPSWAYFGAQTRAWELALGALLAISVPLWTRMPPALASQMSWVGLALILFAAWRFTSSSVFPGHIVAVPVLGSAFVLAGGCPGWPRAAEMVLRRKPMQLLGKLSYSWYLWHWPVLILAPQALGHSLNAAQKLVAVVGSLVLAVATFYLLEQPIRTRQGLVRVPVRGLSMGAALVAASIAVALAIAGATRIPGGGASGSTPVASPHIAASLTAVEQAVAGGAALHQLPADLSPSLARAPHDYPDTGACFTSYAATSPPPERQCTFGDTAGRKSITLVGDSHANAWFPAVDAFAKAQHWKLVYYGKPACPPAVYSSWINPVTQRIYTECNQWRDEVFRRVRASRPDVVFVTSQIRTVGIDTVGMTRTVDAFRSAGAKVVYLEDTPFAGYGSVPDCLAKNPTDITRCAIARHNPADRLDGMIQRSTEVAAARRAGASLIDPVPWFCTSSVCPAVIDGKVVYSDNSHVTATYNRWLAPQLSKALQRIVG